MIPVAARLLEMGHKVVIGSGEDHIEFFRSEIPGIKCISFPGFKPSYSGILPQWLALLFKTPRLIYHSIREHCVLKGIIRDNNIDIVISDNRLGLWNRKIKSVYFTHLLRIPFPKPFRLVEFTGVLLHREIIKRYDYCYIPDLPGELNISGRLSHGLRLPGNARYIGILSRFSYLSGTGNGAPVKGRYNCVILSGPEPQRTILKRKLLPFLSYREPVTVFLEGKPGKEASVSSNDKIIFLNHLVAPEMKELITGSQSIITRSGYTTIMELISLGCSALLIPTPGQTEQEYLASCLAEKEWFKVLAQKKISSDLTFASVKPSWPEEINTQSKALFDKELGELLSDKDQYHRRT
jgi:hypothetical protein